LVFYRTGHRRRSLACADHHQAALGRSRQVTEHAQRRLRSGDSAVEHVAQQLAVIERHDGGFQVWFCVAARTPRKMGGSHGAGRQRRT